MRLESVSAFRRLFFLLDSQILESFLLSLKWIENPKKLPHGDYELIGMHTIKLRQRWRNKNHDFWESTEFEFRQQFQLFDAIQIVQ